MEIYQWKRRDSQACGMNLNTDKFKDSDRDAIRSRTKKVQKNAKYNDHDN